MYCNATIRRWAHKDRQLVAKTLQPGAVKPLQRKRAQQDDIIKRPPAKLQSMKKHIENIMEIQLLCYFHVLINERSSIIFWDTRDADRKASINCVQAE